ncbi:hypothetical protein F2P45_15675 [Massilia sp. CCM 8733]|uniref:Carboxypeptidase regulatory-like domain-containing protein n=1 Tax=Massilia mucilaginosa TaxID=2609282 RepID=A0ABX0NVG1_9BURK|nr:hypothetical protein [Massilia mucilaginosa]NHZ90447.1 hypothetical protein [Massilia mucilaginosa]
MKTLTLSLAMLVLLAGCAGGVKMPKPTYPASYDANLEADYAPFLVDGTAELSGQAFLVQKGGGTVKAAGRVITLGPVTTISQNWWMQAGRVWIHRASLPPSEGFTKARPSVTADADGRFNFTKLSAGSYYVRSELTWTVPFHGVQGGLLTSSEDVAAGETKTIMLNGTK